MKQYTKYVVQFRCFGMSESVESSDYTKMLNLYRAMMDAGMKVRFFKEERQLLGGNFEDH